MKQTQPMIDPELLYSSDTYYPLKEAAAMIGISPYSLMQKVKLGPMIDEMWHKYRVHMTGMAEDVVQAIKRNGRWFVSDSEIYRVRCSMPGQLDKDGLCASLADAIMDYARPGTVGQAADKDAFGEYRFWRHSVRNHRAKLRHPEDIPGPPTP